MSLTWFLKALIGSQKTTGLFSYLAARDHNRSKIELEKARQATTADLLDHLPRGALLRESTADGWREIWIPPLPPAPLFVLPADARVRLQGGGAIETQPRDPEEIERDDSPRAEG